MRSKEQGACIKISDEKGVRSISTDAKVKIEFTMSNSYMVLKSFLALDKSIFMALRPANFRHNYASARAFCAPARVTGALLKDFSEMTYERQKFRKITVHPLHCTDKFSVVHIFFRDAM